MLWRGWSGDSGTTTWGGRWDPQKRQGTRRGVEEGEDAQGAWGGEGRAKEHHEHRGGKRTRSRLAASARVCARWWCLHRGRGVNPTPRDVSDILFIRKEPFSIPRFPENIRQEKKKKKKKALRLIKGKCSQLGKTEVFSPAAYKKQQTAGFSASPSPPPFPSTPSACRTPTTPQLRQARWQEDAHQFGCFDVFRLWCPQRSWQSRMLRPLSILFVLRCSELLSNGGTEGLPHRAHLPRTLGRHRAELGSSSGCSAERPCPTAGKGRMMQGPKYLASCPHISKHRPLRKAWPSRGLN